MKYLKLNLFFVISLFFVSNFASAKDLKKDFNYQDQDKKWSLGLNGGLAQTSFSFDTPAAHSILRWQDLKGYQIGADFSYKFFENKQKDSLLKNLEGFLSYSYSRFNSGTGTDDDLDNSDSTVGTFSIQDAKGHADDLRMGLNFGVINNQNWLIAPRLGYFQKSMTLDMLSGVIIDVNESADANGAGVVDEVYGLGQKTNSTLKGATIGLKIDHVNPTSSVTSFILDFYPAVSYKGNQYWPQRDPVEQRWSLKNDKAGLGFKLSLEHKFSAAGQNFKLYSNYERIRIKGLKESADGYTIEGGGLGSVAKGQVDFDSFIIGLGLFF